MAAGRDVVRCVEKRLSWTFRQPPGEQVAAEGVRGYYIDMRVKASSIQLSEAWPWHRGTHVWVGLTQAGLGAFERYLAGEGEAWLDMARQASDELCSLQVRGGRRDGAWEHAFEYPHTFALRSPWVSAMAQGQAASLLVRTYVETGTEEHADAAARAIRLNSIPSEQGGASALLDGDPFPQEYPTEPASFVLNGGIYAMWGWRDVGLGLGDAQATALYENAIDTLARNIHRWDIGWWSRYDLLDRRISNVASLAYHQLHVHQLGALQRISPRPELSSTLSRFATYSASPVPRGRALLHKVAFRTIYPRVQHVAAREVAPGERRDTP